MQNPYNNEVYSKKADEICTLFKQKLRLATNPYKKITIKYLNNMKCDFGSVLKCLNFKKYDIS